MLTEFNQRFLILPGVSIKNLASGAPALNAKRLSAGWETVYGHPIVVVETFVDHSRFKGTCYRAAGWVPLGMTTGYGRTGGIYYYHGQSKTVLVKVSHFCLFAVMKPTGGGGGGGATTGIGPEGGKVSILDGKAVIEAPAGALDKKVNITITKQDQFTAPATDLKLLGDVFEFAPTGTKFSKPVNERRNYIGRRPCAGRSGSASRRPRATLGWTTARPAPGLPGAATSCLC